MNTRVNKSKNSNQVSTPIAGGGPSSSSDEEILQDIDPAPDVINSHDTAAQFVAIFEAIKGLAQETKTSIASLTRRLDDIDAKPQPAPQALAFSSTSFQTQDARSFIPPRTQSMRTSHPMTHSSHRFYNEDEENKEPVTHPSLIPVPTACFSLAGFDPSKIKVISEVTTHTVI